MQTLKLEGRDGKRFTPPTYSHAYRLQTVGEANEQGNWKGIRITMDHVLEDAEADLYVAAQAFRAQVSSGGARVEPPSAENAEEDSDNF